MARILILGKAGPPGTAKTRLIPDLGVGGADRVHHALAGAVVARARQWCPQVHLALDPVPNPLPDWAAGTNVLPQPAGDLGRRLTELSESLRAEMPLVILGTDAPDLPYDRIEQAIAACRDGAAVICPSHDGGYNLVALPTPLPELFAGIDWGSERVAEQTRTRAADGGIRLVETEPWEDVDTLHDLQRLQQRLAETKEPPLIKLQQALNAVKLPQEKGDLAVSETRQILIADDNPQILELLEAYLEPLALQIRTARDGEQVLDEIRQERPDLLLLDIMMPKRSGYEVCRVLKAESEWADIPIILVTALNEEGDRQRGEESGADDFISKPVNKMVLLEKVQKLIGLGG